mgnify:CR=1 FL=1
MNASEMNLWSRIDGYTFDAVDAALPFSARLARDNNWTLSFAKRAIEEYKKFVFLAVTAGHPVTPSDEVDEVWHLHLLYTRSYWDEFCKILGRPLHHSPTLGGTQEGRKFRAWYENTLNAYSKVFGSAAPADIWPDPDRRFAGVSECRRINTRVFWVIPKPCLSKISWMAAVVVPLLGLTSCKFSDDNPRLGGLLIIILMGIVVLMASIPEKTKKKDSNHGNANSNGGGSGVTYSTESNESGGDGGCGGGCGCG